MRPRHPLGNLLLAALCFGTIDAAIFKTGLYRRFAARDSIRAEIEDEIADVTARTQAPGRERAIVIGSSIVATDVAPERAEGAIPNAPLQIIKAGFPDLSSRDAYYFLRKLDPTRERYRMIVVALPFFEGAADLGMQPQDASDIEVLSPVVPLGDYLDFAAGLDDAGMIGRALSWRAFGSPGYADDVQDLLTGRLRAMAREPGQPPPGLRLRRASMTGLAFDPVTQVIHFPDGLSEKQKKTVARLYRAAPLEERQHDAAVSAAFMRKWLGRIVADYRGSGALVVFLRLPTRPTRLPAIEPPPGAPSVVEPFRGEPHVEIIDGAKFDRFERPECFRDTRHLNDACRGDFSTALLEALVEIRARRLGPGR